MDVDLRAKKQDEIFCDGDERLLSEDHLVEYGGEGFSVSAGGLIRVSVVYRGKRLD